MTLESIAQTSDNPNTACRGRLSVAAQTAAYRDEHQSLPLTAGTRSGAYTRYSIPVSRTGRKIMQYIHLLSSAARSLYAQDIVRVLAMPNGGVLHFRYSKSLVHDQIIQASRCNALVGTKVLISFLDISDKGQSPEIIPCRVGTLTKSGTIGEFFLIEFRVEEFAVSSNPAMFRSEVNGALPSTGDTVSLPEWTNDGTKIDVCGHWVFNSHDKLTSLTTRYDTISFVKVCRFLSLKKPFRITYEENGHKQKSTQDFFVGPFYHALIFSGNVSQFEIDDIETTSGYIRIDKNQAVLQIEGGRLYTLAIVHYHPDLDVGEQFEPRRVHITLRHVTNIAEEVFNDILASKYDLKQFKFETATYTKRLDAFIEIALHDEGTGATKKYSGISIPVIVKPSWWSIGLEATVSALPASIPAAIAFGSATASFDTTTSLGRWISSLSGFEPYILYLVSFAVIVAAPSIIKLSLIKLRTFTRGTR